MVPLKYDKTIQAGKSVVWTVLTDPGYYRKWAAAFSAESQFRGDWQSETTMEFFDPNLGGTKAFLEEVIPGERIHVRHVAILGKDGSEDTKSDMAKKWIGITETYELTEMDGKSTLSVVIHTHKDFVYMFQAGWPKALGIIQELCVNKELHKKKTRLKAEVL